MCRWNEKGSLPHEKIANLAQSYYVINYVLRIFQFGEWCKTVSAHTPHSFQAWWKEKGFAVWRKQKRQATK